TGGPRPLERGSEEEGGFYECEANISGQTLLEDAPALVCTNPLEAKEASAQKRARRPGVSLEEVRDLLSPHGPDVVAFFDASEDVWADWLAYRSEIRKPYKSSRSFALLVRCAQRDAEGDVDAVRAAVERSRANGWQGLFVRPVRAKKEPQGAPYSLQAAPVGAPTPERLLAEMRSFYDVNQELFDALKSATPRARMDYAPLLRDFCAYRVRAGRFGDTFAQHHAALELFARECFSKGVHIF
ncbi:MAG: hypothetical protein NZM43_13805, partial [Saprospiraceae bacterium]|nr:hypothetical protein [Saprospiraceae bacterium]MDW8485390.1 hypothetical protein [Saprospiraceae bacterium]